MKRRAKKFAKDPFYNPLIKKPIKKHKSRQDNARARKRGIHGRFQKADDLTEAEP